MVAANVVPHNLTRSRMQASFLPTSSQLQRKFLCGVQLVLPHRQLVLRRILQQRRRLHHRCNIKYKRRCSLAVAQLGTSCWDYDRMCDLMAGENPPPSQTQAPTVVLKLYGMQCVIESTHFS